MEIVLFLLGLGCGVGVGIFLRAQSLAALREGYERQIGELRMTDEKLNIAFSATAAAVLQKNAHAYQQSAEKDLKQVKTEAVGEMEQRKQAIEGAVKELRDQLKQANERIGLFEKERGDVYGKLSEQLQQMAAQERKLILETQNLKSALTTSSAVRGRWGEMVLRNIFEASGLKSGIDFDEQTSTNNDDGDRLRPDFVVHLPQSGQELAIDAKTSLYESFLDAESAGSEEERRAQHAEFAKKLKTRVQDLASKEYQKFVSDAVPYVVMFVPSESAIRAAFDADPELFRYAASKRIMMTSPITIIPLILLIAQARRLYTQSAQAVELSACVATLGERLNRFVERLAGVQLGLERTTKAWNEAIEQSWHGRQGVQKSIEKANDLGANFAAADMRLIAEAPVPFLNEGKSPEKTLV